ncbi:hypothetical protein AVEN_94942-1 [Araneus ventricosus]|uniref:Uncharacterized protein n=1 Tax=Araneus ventricosus TaxID=182803 RepID=A0A4Y2DI19_ARAVE|nr:hypothetical protein AVEN_94942-1 [Araneus ventricosus]
MTDEGVSWETRRATPPEAQSDSFIIFSEKAIAFDSCNINRLQVGLLKCNADGMYFINQVFNVTNLAAETTAVPRNQVGHQERSLSGGVLEFSLLFGTFLEAEDESNSISDSEEVFDFKKCFASRIFLELFSRSYNFLKFFTMSVLELIGVGILYFLVNYSSY